jgi:hypothetical protein
MDITSPQVWIGWIIAGLAAYLGAYLAEKAKRRAAHEDSDQIRIELARNTQAVKEIEAKVNSDLWDRQWRLNQKRDVYARLLESMAELELSLKVISKYVQMRPVEYIAGELDEHGAQVKQVGRELERAMAIGKVYLPKDAVSAIEGLELELRKPSAELEYAAVCSSLAHAQEGLTSAAKADLGF